MQCAVFTIINQLIGVGAVVSKSVIKAGVITVSIADILLVLSLAEISASSLVDY